VILTNTLIRDYSLNYAWPLLYTTSLSNAAIIAASCSFDPRGRHSQKGTFSLPPFRYQAKSLTTLHAHHFSLLLRSSRPMFTSTLRTSRSASSHPSLRRLFRRRTISAGSPSTTTLDDATSNANYTAFDALGPCPVRSPPRPWTERTPYQLAYCAKERRSSACVFTR